MTRLGARLFRDLSAPAQNTSVGVFPLAVLTGLFFVDQVDSLAFNVLAPDIKAEFHLSGAGFGAVVGVNFLATLTLSLFVGYLGDRFSRVGLMRLGALVAAAGSVLTGLAPTVLALVLFRMVNGVGILTTGPVHRSLICDYYPAQRRGRMFAIHEGADRAAGLVGPLLAAGLALLFGWRGPFLILWIPIAILFVVSFRMPEPLRGLTDNATAAEAAGDEAPFRLARASRVLWQIKTFRRTWLGLVFVGAGFLPVAAFLQLFYSSVFGVGVLGRGLIGALSAVAAMAGLAIGGRLTSLWVAERPDRVQFVAGMSFVLIAVGLVMLAMSSTLTVAVCAGAFLSMAGGVFAPMTTSVQALVCPARVRGVGFAFGGLFLAAGVLLAPLAGDVADKHGLRFGLVAFAPLVVVGGVLLASASRFVVEDARRALVSLELAAQVAEQRRTLGDDSLLICRGLDVGYGGVQVLFDVDLEIKRGDVVALLGTNGAGKSTLLKAIVGLVQPTSGSVFFDGEDIAGLEPRDAALRGITLMPGGKAVFPSLSVEENLRIAAWRHRNDAAFVAQKTEEVLEIFPRLRDRLKQPAGNLSGGEQQMIALAQTLLTEPQLLMIDELTLGLAPAIVQELFPIVQRIAEAGVTVILVEQSVNLALSLADYAFFMEKGEVRFSGPTAELLERRDLLRSVFLEGAAKGLVAG
jgi:branched-chain amino acid transport system ATP-binding protein